jgi:hypothetical protein
MRRAAIMTIILSALLAGCADHPASGPSPTRTSPLTHSPRDRVSEVGHPETSGPLRPTAPTG